MSVTPGGSRQRPPPGALLPKLHVDEQQFRNVGGSVDEGRSGRRYAHFLCESSRLWAHVVFQPLPCCVFAQATPRGQCFSRQRSRIAQ